MSSENKAIGSILGYTFKDASLITEAFTHPSLQLGGGNNQRLEFLGDSVIDFILADSLFRNFPDDNEGDLTRRRSFLSNGSFLAAKALEHGFDKLLRVARGYDTRNEHTLEDAFEAVIGAIYLDGGIAAAATVLKSIFASAIAELPQKPSVIETEGPKSALQAFTQRIFAEAPKYEIIHRKGPDCAPVFTARVSVREFAAEGEGKSKRLAQSAAAATLLKILEENEKSSIP